MSHSVPFRPVIALSAWLALGLAVGPPHFSNFLPERSLGLLFALMLALGACLMRQQHPGRSAGRGWFLLIGALLFNLVPIATYALYSSHQRILLCAGLLVLVLVGGLRRGGWRVLPGALLAAAAFGLATDGMRSGDVSRCCLFLGTGLLALAAVCFLRRDGPWPLPGSLLAAAALVLAAKDPHFLAIAHDDSLPAFAVVRAMKTAALGLNALWVLDLAAPRGVGPGFRTRMALVFAVGAILRIGVLAATPQPDIDVFVWLQDAADALAAGINPYTATWPVPSYPPLSILMVLPFRVFHHDVRWAHVACDLAAGAVLYLAGRQRGQPLIGAVAAAIHLSLPGTEFMTKFAWIEPIVAASLGTGWLLAERGRRLGVFLVAVGLTGKQFGIPLFVPTWRALRGRYLVALPLATLLVGAVLGLPFLCWDARAFLDDILLLHLDRPTVLESLTLISCARYWFGWVIPPSLPWLLSATLIGWVSWRTPARGLAAAFWVGTALFVFVLCHPQGFFNYYYLCEYLMLLGSVGLMLDWAEGAAADRRTETLPAPVPLPRAA